MIKTKALSLSLLLLVPSVLAQDEEHPEPTIEIPGGENDQMAELRELFAEVEHALDVIDLELADAGAGESSLAEVPDAGIDDLLRQTMSRSNKVQSQIDRILEIAQQMGQGSSGGGGGAPSQGESPLDEQRDTGPKQREQTPEAPESGEPQEEDKNKPGGSKPKDGPQKDPTSGENRAGTDPQNPSGDPVPHGDEADEWGFLPDRLRQVFRNQGKDELPVRYRDWIDTYYLRLSTSNR